jgi:hypothetical protein
MAADKFFNHEMPEPHEKFGSVPISAVGTRGSRVPGGHAAGIEERETHNAPVAPATRARTSQRLVPTNN